MTAYHPDKTWIMDIKLKSVWVEWKILLKSDVLEEKRQLGQGMVKAIIQCSCNGDCYMNKCKQLENMNQRHGLYYYDIIMFTHWSVRLLVHQGCTYCNYDLSSLLCLLNQVICLEYVLGENKTLKSQSLVHMTHNKMKIEGQKLLWLHTHAIIRSPTTNMYWLISEYFELRHCQRHHDHDLCVAKSLLKYVKSDLSEHTGGRWRQNSVKFMQPITISKIEGKQLL